MSKRFRCSTATRKRFVMAVNELLAARRIADILEVMFLDGQLLDATNSLVSIKVDRLYRLEITCHEANGQLTGITIHRFKEV